MSTSCSKLYISQFTQINSTNLFHVNDSLSFFTFFQLRLLPLSSVTVYAIIKVQKFSNHFKKVLLQKREQFYSKKTFSYLLNDKLVRLRR